MSAPVYRKSGRSASPEVDCDGMAVTKEHILSEISVQASQVHVTSR